MKPLTVGYWEREIDSEATGKLFRSEEKGFPERCRCTECQNYLATFARPYPTAVYDLLQKLGIDPLKECDVSYFGQSNQGLHKYEGWFLFVGMLLEEGFEKKKQQNESLASVGN